MYFICIEAYIEVIYRQSNGEKQQFSPEKVVNSLKIPKGIVISRKSKKEKQYNGKQNEKKTKNCQENTTQRLRRSN
jgi:hypothetical protein